MKRLIALFVLSSLPIAWVNAAHYECIPLPQAKERGIPMQCQIGPNLSTMFLCGTSRMFDRKCMNETKDEQQENRQIRIDSKSVPRCLSDKQSDFPYLPRQCLLSSKDFFQGGGCSNEQSLYDMSCLRNYNFQSCQTTDYRSRNQMIEKERQTETNPKWIKFKNLDSNHQKHHAVVAESKKGNFEQIDFAYVSLRENSNEKFLLVRNTNADYCGSNGRCSVVILRQKSSFYQPFVEVYPIIGSTSLGRDFNLGMRNLRSGGITLTWNGNEYVVK